MHRFVLEGTIEATWFSDLATLTAIREDEQTVLLGELRDDSLVWEIFARIYQLGLSLVAYTAP
jgi:hypothetical protein